MLLAALLTILALMVRPAVAREPGIWELCSMDGAMRVTGHDGRRTVTRLPANIARGIRARRAAANAGGAVMTAAGALLDDEVRDTIAGDEDSLAEFADDYLGPSGLGVLTLMLFTGGSYAQDPRCRSMSCDLGASAIGALGLTGVIKTTTDRERPKDGGVDSFLSGKPPTPSRLRPSRALITANGSLLRRRLWQG